MRHLPWKGAANAESFCFAITPPPRSASQAHEIVDGVTGVAERCEVARSLAAFGIGDRVVVPESDGVETESGWCLLQASSEGRPWSTMLASTCRWKAPACALSISRDGSCAKP